MPSVLFVPLHSFINNTVKFLPCNNIFLSPNIASRAWPWLSPLNSPPPYSSWVPPLLVANRCQCTTYVHRNVKCNCAVKRPETSFPYRFSIARHFFVGLYFCLFVYVQTFGSGYIVCFFFHSTITITNIIRSLKY